jgi:probable rRNA maturation factor
MRTTFVNHAGAGSRQLSEWRGFLRDCDRRLEVGTGEVAVLLCDDEEIASLNQRFRGQAGPTDVLSFPYRSAGPDGRLHLGDIAVSLETAARQARGVGWDLDREVKRLLVHGILHLLGYDHESDGGEMHQLERDLLGSLIGEVR